MFCGIHLRAMSQEVLTKLMRNMCSNYTFKFATTFPRGQWVNHHKFLCCQVIQEESKMLPYFVIVIDVPLEAKYKHLATTQGFTQGWVVSRKLDDFHALHQRLIQVLHMHDDIIKWKHFPRYWSVNKRLGKQSWGWWFRMSLCPLCIMTSL